MSAMDTDDPRLSGTTGAGHDGPTGLDEGYGVQSGEPPNFSGNYIVTVGNPGSGKSSLQNYIVWRLWHDEGIAFDYQSQNGSHKHDANLNAWVQDFSRGYLPARTTQGLLQSYSISMAQRKRPKLALSFLEVSGEDLVAIVPSQQSSQPPALDARLTELLASSCNFRFVFVSDVQRCIQETGRGGDISEDVLFSTFLKHLVDPNGAGLKNIRALFVAAKWDVAARQYPSERRYFREHFPQTRAVVSSTSKISASYVPFSVGAVSIDSAQRPRITRHDRLSGSLVINWLYHSFTGRELQGFPRVKRTLLDRLMFLLGSGGRG